jgi:hypothetical protein
MVPVVDAVDDSQSGSDDGDECPEDDADHHWWAHGDDGGQLEDAVSDLACDHRHEVSASSSASSSASAAPVQHPAPGFPAASSNQQVADDAQVRPGRRFGPLDPNRPNKPIRWIIRGGAGSLVFQPKQKLLAAHCCLGGKGNCHGPIACRLNRKTTENTGAREYQGRPLGLLAAWLLAPADDRDSHYNISLHDPDGFLSYDNRVAARQWLIDTGVDCETDPHFTIDDLLECERQQRDDEDGPEPRNSK